MQVRLPDPLRFFRRRRKQYPTPKQAKQGIAEDRCLYSLLARSFSPRIRHVGLRDKVDPTTVPICSGHYGRLRKLDERRLDKLERALRKVA